MKLAVYFPGVGYHCDKPLLYYARKIAAACGYEQHITLSYTTQIRDLLGNPANMKAAFLELYEQAESTLDKTAAFSQQSGDPLVQTDSFSRQSVFSLTQADSRLLHSDEDSGCDEILFISKSVGTAIAARYASEHNIPCRHILYTPLAETFTFHPWNGIAFTGTADPWVTTAVIQQQCQEHQIPLFLYDGANHSLETGDVFRNLDIMKEVMQKTEEFIRKGIGSHL